MVQKLQSKGKIALIVSLVIVFGFFAGLV